jgi:hypothetical protein
MEERGFARLVGSQGDGGIDVEGALRRHPAGQKRQKSELGIKKSDRESISECGLAGAAARSRRKAEWRST